MSRIHGIQKRSFLAASAFFATVIAITPNAKADIINWQEFDVNGVAVAGPGSSGTFGNACGNLGGVNTLAPTQFCNAAIPLTLSQHFTFSGSDTETNLFGLVQTMRVSLDVVDDTGFRGSILFTDTQNYAFGGIATGYTAFDFLSGKFDQTPGTGVDTVFSTLIADGVTLPILCANDNLVGAQPVAYVGSINLGGGGCNPSGITPGIASFNTGLQAGVTFVGAVQFNFLSALTAANDEMDVPFGESDAPEPGTMMLLGAGVVAMGAVRIRRRRNA